MSFSIKPWTLLQKGLPGANLESFSFGMPLETLKSAAEGTDGRRGLKGVASTPKKDLQDESVIQKGMDLRYFLEHGYFNDDHKPGAQNKVGQPTKAIIKKVKPRNGPEVLGLWTEGYLWKAGLHDGADNLWELANAIQQTPDSTRSMAFSIQGKVLVREGKKIVKAWVQDIAITPSPINTDTWLELCHNLSKSVWASESEVNSMYKSMSHHSFLSDELMEDDGWDEMDNNLLKSFVVASRGDSPGSEDGHPLVPESLEGNLKMTSYGTGRRKDHVSKALEWAYLAARNRGHGPSEARALALSTATRCILS